jgi:hypothetical protein
MTKNKLQRPKVKPPRNNNLFDTWSLIHFSTGILFGWLLDPFAALVIMVLWEPLEILVLSPLLWRHGILFGHETINNSLSDIVFDTAGICFGYWLLTNLIDAPFHLF